MVLVQAGMSGIMHRMVYTFLWANNDKRHKMASRECVIIAKGAKRSALVEFLDNGQREVVSVLALRRVGKREMPQRLRYRG